MAEAAAEYNGGEKQTAELERLRYLTEVSHLLEHRNPDGTYSAQALEGVSTNLVTAVQEISMPYAVTTTYQPAAEVFEPDSGRRKRTFMWLGRSALEVALSGKKYHFSAPALERVAIEADEAGYSEDNLDANKAQVFLSPRMSEFDAPKHIAKAEHLGRDDQVRVSWAATDEQGKVIGRFMQSLLVRNIPLPAWIAMLKDSGNIFGTSFPISDERSATSVMELFRELALPRDSLPEGPITLVEAVIQYITDSTIRKDVLDQLDKFRANQAFYAAQAETAASEWLEFEMALADSLYEGQANDVVRKFIVSLQNQWNDEALDIISRHHISDAQYQMTTELAALVEKAKQNLINAKASIVTGNEMVLEQLDPQALMDIQTQIEFMNIAAANGAASETLSELGSKVDRTIAKENVKVEGGCPGDNDRNFVDRKNGDSPFKSKAENKDSWKKYYNLGCNCCRCTQRKSCADR